jgi:hypothetical protein
METIGLVVFFVALAAACACGICSWILKSEARNAVVDQGGEVPLSLCANIAIDVRRLQGAAVAPAIRSNMAAGLAVAFMAIGCWGSFIADPAIMSLVFAGLFTMFVVIGLRRLFQISKPLTRVG